VALLSDKEPETMDLPVPLVIGLSESSFGKVLSANIGIRDHDWPQTGSALCIGDQELGEEGNFSMVSCSGYLTDMLSSRMRIDSSSITRHDL
jgi:hypothetical protein